jgi:hypothetical protein
MRSDHHVETCAIYLTTRDVANIIGLKSTKGVVNLIERGMLPCSRRRVMDRARISYRPTVHEVHDYLRTYDPRLVPVLEARWPRAFEGTFHVP